MKRTSLSAAIVAALAICLTIASVAHAGPIKKLYEVDITAVNPPVTVGQPETFKVVIKNKTATQTLGSCNLTLPASLSGVSVTQPTPAPGTATLVGNVVQLRNLSTAAMASKEFFFTATSPTAGTYAATVECRQANNYAPSTSSNAFTLDAANSTLSWTASNPIPNADLAIATTEESFDPTSGGNTVKYVLTVTNNGPNPSGSTVSVTDTVSGDGNLSMISGTGWSCGGTGNTRTCTTGQIPVGGTATLDVRVVANFVTSTSTMTNSATVSQSGDKNDNVPGNNGTSQTTTINPGDTSGSGYVDNQTGGVVSMEPSATAFNKFVGRIVFPALEGATPGGFFYSMAHTTDTCALLPCTFALHIDDVPAGFDNPVTEAVRLTIRCDATVCAGTGTAVTMFVRDETGSQKVVLGCNFLGIADPNPCLESSRRLVGGTDNGDLEITMLFLAGDPKVAGLCVGAC